MSQMEDTITKTIGVCFPKTPETSNFKLTAKDIPWGSLQLMCEHNLWLLKTKDKLDNSESKLHISEGAAGTIAKGTSSSWLQENDYILVLVCNVVF